MIRAMALAGVPTVEVTDRPAWAAAGLVVVGVLAALDLAVAGSSAFIGLLVAGPFVAAMGVGPLLTGAVGLVAVSTGTALLADAGVVPGAGLALRLGALVACCGLAVLIARQRVLRERTLVRVQAVAEAAQRAILPREDVAVQAVGFAARYRSAAEEALVGGDMYEVAETVHGIRLLIGDTRGKGLDAVQLTSVVLGAFRVGAHTLEDPADVVRLMADATARAAGPEDFVTAVLLELRGSRVTVLNCGHPPPLLLGRAGGAELLTTPPTTPLGLAPDPTAVSRSWAPGDRLLLYTDGLVEARDAAGRFFPLGRAAELCRPARSGLDACLDGLLSAAQAHAGGHLGDDLALVLVERPRDRA